MKFSFLKSIALMASCSAMVGMYSCNSDDELAQDVASPKETITKTIELTAEEFDAMVENVANDSTVESYSYFDPNEISSLKSNRDTYDPNHGPKMLLKSLRGIRYSGRIRNRMKGYINDPNSSWYGWYIFDVDLNDGAGGDYLYLAACFNYFDDGYAITSLSGYQYLPYDKEIVLTSNLDYFNCNFGTKKGGPIYLGVNRQGNGETPITAMMIVSYATNANDKVGSYRKDVGGMDLNKGAGGRYIYIFTKH